MYKYLTSIMTILLGKLDYFLMYLTYMCYCIYKKTQPKTNSFTLIGDLSFSVIDFTLQIIKNNCEFHHFYIKDFIQYLFIDINNCINIFRHTGLSLISICVYIQMLIPNRQQSENSL